MKNGQFENNAERSTWAPGIDTLILYELLGSIGGPGRPPHLSVTTIAKSGGRHVRK